MISMGQGHVQQLPGLSEEPDSFIDYQLAQVLPAWFGCAPEGISCGAALRPRIAAADDRLGANLSAARLPRMWGPASFRAGQSLKIQPAK